MPARARLRIMTQAASEMNEHFRISCKMVAQVLVHANGRGCRHGTRCTHNHHAHGHAHPSKQGPHHGGRGAKCMARPQPRCSELSHQSLHPAARLLPRRGALNNSKHAAKYTKAKRARGCRHGTQERVPTRKQNCRREAVAAECVALRTGRQSVSSCSRF